MVADQPAGKAREDRGEARRPRALHDLPNGGGRGAARSVPAHSSDDRRASTKANGAMLNHPAPPHVPTDGRTASDDPLNGPRYQLPTAQSWIGSRPRWTRGEIWRFRASRSSLEALFFRHSGRIDRPYGECQIKISVRPFCSIANGTEHRRYRCLILRAPRKSAAIIRGPLKPKNQIQFTSSGM